MIDKDLRFQGKCGVSLSKDVYLYKNFYNKIELIEQSLNDMTEDDWNTHGNYLENDHKDGYWNGRLSLDFVDRDFHDSIINFVSPKYWSLSHGNFIRSRPIDCSVVQDMSGLNGISYVVSYYAGNFTGGEIYFNDLGLTYQPEKNDLIIFKPTEIKILEVVSGIRYSYLDYLIEHPGYFMV